MARKKSEEKLELERINKTYYDHPTKHSRVAMGKPMSEGVRVSFTLTTMKLLMMCLEQIHWADKENGEGMYESSLVYDKPNYIAKSSMNDHGGYDDGGYSYNGQDVIIWIDKKKLAEKLGIKVDSHGSYIKYINQHLKTAFKEGDIIVGKNLRTNREVMYHLFQMLDIQDNHVRVVLNSKFSEWLFPKGKKNALGTHSFITLWAHDVYQMKSDFSPRLYIYLRTYADTRKVNEQTISTKKMKEILGLSKEDYMRRTPSERTGKKSFDRYNFEKYALNVALEEINAGNMIEIIPFDDGKLFQRVNCVKETGQCEYKIQWIVKSYLIKTDTGELQLVKDKPYGSEEKTVDVYKSTDDRYFLSTVGHNQYLLGTPVKKCIAEHGVDPRSLSRIEVPVRLVAVEYEIPERYSSILTNNVRAIVEVKKRNSVLQLSETDCP